MIRPKYWITMIGWKTNGWVHSSGVLRLPLVGTVWFAGKRLAGRWLASGQGVLIDVGGEPTRVHPFTIVYSIGEWEPYTEELFQNAIKPGFTVLDIGAHHGIEKRLSKIGCDLHRCHANSYLNVDKVMVAIPAEPAP